MPDYLNIAGRVRTTAADGVVAEAQEVKDLLKNKSQQELNNDFSTAIEAILLLIPSAASSLNQLADKAFVNSSIATASATFRGTYNLVTDLSLTVSDTHAQIATALGGAVSGEDNNDYAFVQIPTSDATPTQIAKTERYKFNGTTWEYEYDLNNSGYTAAQWAAINSGITAALVSKLSALPTNADLTTALGVLTEGIAAINAKIPSAASSSNKLVDNSAMVAYIGQIIDAIDATFNVTSTDGHVTVQITQVNGVITAVNVTTSDIASDADLSLLAGRVTTAEGNISTNAQDIAALQAAYTGLTQNDCIVVEPTDTWPVSNPSQNIIYRVVDRVNTPPQNYSDYMYNGTDMVLMATYDNAIDDVPTPGSNNLVKSGGVASHIVYDISEANAVGSTLATYANLAAALGADGANVPQSIRKGGMSVKFVQSYDNKYVQYRLKTDEWSTDTDDWSVLPEITEIENPEFVEVHVDKKQRVVWGVNSDGNFFFGAGCPKQVREYLEAKIVELHLNSVTDILNFLGTIEGTTLAELLNGKVDKVEGKSLIGADVAENVEFVENPVYIDVKVDKDGKILEDITTEGKKEIHIPTVIGGAIFEEIDNPEWAKVETDKEGRITEGTRKNGKKVFPGGIEGVPSAEEIEELKNNIEGYSFIKNVEAANTLKRFIPYSIGSPSSNVSFDDQYKRLNLLFFTDSHIDGAPIQATLQNVDDTIKLAKDSGITFDAIIHAGDIITPFGVYTKEEEKAKAAQFFDICKTSTIPVIFSKGNHDTNDWSNYATNVFDDSDWSEMWYDFAESHYGIVRQLKQNGEKSTWHYYDIENKKVRIICLDVQDVDKTIVNENNKVVYYGGVAWYISNEQFNWIANTALNFDDKSDKDWGVIIVSHQGTKYGIDVKNPNNYQPVSEWASGSSYVIGNLAKNNNISYICIEANSDAVFDTSKWKELNPEKDIDKFALMLKAFNEQSSYSESYNFSGNAFYNLSVNADWSRYAELDNKPHIIYWILGHEHVDINESVNGIIEVWTANGSPSNVSSDARLARVIGTSTQNCFDLISIDRRTRKIRYIRYGAGVNCYGNGGDRFIPEGLSY